MPIRDDFLDKIKTFIFWEDNEIVGISIFEYDNLDDNSGIDLLFGDLHDIWEWGE